MSKVASLSVMTLISTFRSRRLFRGPVVLWALAIGLTIVVSPSCVPAATFIADASPASTAGGGSGLDLAGQATNKLQTECMRHAVDAGPHCDSTVGQACVTVDPVPTNYLVKPTDESPGPAALPASCPAGPGSSSQLLALHIPPPPSPPPPGRPLRFRYCVYLK
jgi:hypothetical protein